MDICTIYKLYNIVNNKLYIGQTWTSLEDRMGRCGYGYSNSPKLFNAIQAYGHDKFRYEILDYCLNQTEADEKEIYYIAFFNAIESGYNLKEGGSRGKHSQISINKISISSKGRVKSLETCAKLSKALKGKTKRPKTEEEKQNISKHSKEWHDNNDHPSLGIPRTEEDKLAISIASKGRARSKESVEKGAAKLLEKFALSEDKELKIVELYKGGKGLNTLARSFNVNSDKIGKVLVKHNIEKRKAGGSFSNFNGDRNKFAEINKNINNNLNIIFEMYKNDISVDDIAEKFSTNSTKILKLLKKYNVYEYADYITNPKIISDEDEKKIIEMYLSNKYTNVQICEKHNIGNQHLGKILRKHNLINN